MWFLLSLKNLELWKWKVPHRKITLEEKEMNNHFLGKDVSALGHNFPICKIENLNQLNMLPNHFNFLWKEQSFVAFTSTYYPFYIECTYIK